MVRCAVPIVQCNIWCNCNCCNVVHTTWVGGCLCEESCGVKDGPATLPHSLYVEAAGGGGSAESIFARCSLRARMCTVGIRDPVAQKIGSVPARNPRSPESLKMKAALIAGLVAGVLGDGHGGGGSHQSQYGGGGGGGGGGQTAYSSYASGAQDAFNQLGETVPGTPEEDYPVLAEVIPLHLSLLILPK